MYSARHFMDEHGDHAATVEFVATCNGTQKRGTKVYVYCHRTGDDGTEFKTLEAARRRMANAGLWEW